MIVILVKLGKYAVEQGNISPEIQQILIKMAKVFLEGNIPEYIRLLAM